MSTPRELAGWATSVYSPGLPDEIADLIRL